jgi:hypothetical protein
MANIVTQRVGDMSRLSSLFLLALALSACSASQSDRGYVARVDTTATTQTIGPREGLSRPVSSAGESAATAILALPSDAGPPGPMTEKQYVNGWRQSVSLDGKRMAGNWNDLAIDILTDEPGLQKGSRIPMGKPTREGIRREILARFPGTPMRIVGQPMSNALGPFGLAIGAGGGGTRCAFAWQWVNDLRSAGSANGGGKSSFRGRELPASVRMRLCRKGVTADQLASLFEQLEVADMANVDRVAELAQQDTNGNVIEYSSEARSREDVVDASQSLESAIGGGTKTVSDAKRAPRRQAARRRESPRSGPQYTPDLAPTMQYDRGRQYLAPVGGLEAGPQYAAPPAPQASRGAGFGPVRLDPGLPAQAYRGPTGAPGRNSAAGYGGGQPVYLGGPAR